jgi:hypothetical protein
MKKRLHLLSLILLIGCTKNQPKTRALTSSNKTIVSSTKPKTDLKIVEDTTNYDVAIYYIVIADTNLNYHTLQKKMIGLSQQLHIPIDTLGRYYNKVNDSIVLPEDDEDKMYAGQYYPRRDVAEYLSLEYLNLFKEKTKPKTIALVAGMYDVEKKADSALISIQKKAKKAFKIKSEVYIGCLH